MAHACVRATATTMEIDLAYGRRGARITVPDENLVAVVEPDWPGVLTQPQTAVAEALRAPADGPPLEAVLAKRIGNRSRSVGSAGWRGDWRNFRTVIITSDPTRPCPNHDVLVPILQALHEAGIPSDAVTILIATGLHAPTAGEATRRLLGAEIVSKYRIVNHFGHRPVTHVRLGQTKSGTPVVLTREWVEADVRIATGVIEPHLVAGFSGGRKAICPGIAADATVRAFHAPRFIEHERALPGRLDGNPTHAEALAVARFAPPHFTVNVTVDRNEHLTGVFAGTMEGAHEAGVALLRQHVARPVSEPCDILVTTSGGRPLDATFYGAEKGLLPGLPILKPGGTFVWAAALEDGLGPPEFADLIAAYPTIERFHEAIMAEGADVVKDQWALQNFAKAARHGEIVLWSDLLDWEDQQHLFVTPVRSLEAGLKWGFEKHGPDARVVVLPHGPYVLPYLDTETRREATC